MRSLYKDHKANTHTHKGRSCHSTCRHVSSQKFQTEFRWKLMLRSALRVKFVRRI